MRVENGKFKSDGKMIEIMPILIDPVGQPFALPPAFWHVDNEILGFDENHILSSSYSFFSNQRQGIPGSHSNRQVMLTFMVRILEDGEMPSGAIAGHIDASAVKEMLQAIRIAPQLYSSE